MGSEISELESELSEFTNSNHAISCSSGTDALTLALMAIGIKPGDEVITSPFSFIATAETITLLQATPIFVDIDPVTYNIDSSKVEEAITENTRAIIPVSLYGQPSDLDEIRKVAVSHDLKVIVDGAQSFGATYKGKSEVQYCDVYTTSFFPSKPLGCYGDGGAVLTNNSEYAERIRMMRVHGQSKRYQHKLTGIAGRLDTIQAAVLLAKLPHYENEIELRESVANSYSELLSELISQDIPPCILQDRTSVFAQYTIKVENRNIVRDRLLSKGIPTAVHYPLPIHKQECYQSVCERQGSFEVSESVSKVVLSLPMNAFLSQKDIVNVTSSLAEAINDTQYN